MQILKKRLIPTVTALAVAFLALFGFMPQTASAADWKPAGDFLVSGSGYAYDNGVLTINTENASVSIKNADPNTPTNNRIVVETAAKITLCGVNIDVSSKDKTSAFMIADDLDETVEITLEKNTKNILKSGRNCAGLQKNGAYGALHIRGDSQTAILEATGGDFGAGIGSGGYSNCGRIEIIRSVVIARGGKGAAGIGGGNSGNAMYIHVRESIVTSIGGTDNGKGGAGIGGGYYGEGKNIKIVDSSVKAVAGTGANDFGNGAGNGNTLPTNGFGEKVYLLPINNPNKDEIYVDGTLYSSFNHSAIDPDDDVCYAYLTGNTHTIRVGSTEFECFFDSAKNTLYTYGFNLEITTVSGAPPAVYGTHYIYRSDDGILKILQGTSYIIKNRNPNTPTTDTIVVSKDTAATITLAGVNIDVSGIDNACAFKIEDDNANEVVVTLAENTENHLKSGYGCAGLQKNGSGRLTIEGKGSLEATGGNGAAGIGGGFMGDSSNITISGGTVIAKGGENGAGIGGGYMSVGSDITISDGTVTAEGSKNGAGIGGGYGGEGSNIIISGGSVKAVAGANANAIGGGESKGAVTPTNGTDPVYLCVIEIENPNNETLTINGIPYTPNNHTAADSSDTKLYAYLTGNTQFVEVGKRSTHYHFDNDKGVFAEGTPTTTFAHNGTIHWLTCSTEGCLYKMFSSGMHSGGTATCVSKKECEICGAEYGNIDSTNHVNVTTEWSKDETNHWHECLDCGELPDKAAHVSSGAATETTPEACTVCGYVIAPKLGHIHANHLTEVPAKAATCTEDGNKAYFLCECGKLFTDNSAKTETTLAEVTINAAGHTWSDKYGSDETGHWHVCEICGELSNTEKHVSSGAATETTPETCTVCGYVISPELGHIHANHLTEVPAKSATCTEDGNKQYFKCSCGKLYADSAAKTETTLAEMTIKATGHKFGEWVITKPATTTSTGIKSRTCSVCGETEEDTIPKKSSSGSSGGSYRPATPTTSTESKPSINGIEKSWTDIATDISKLPNSGSAVINLNGETSIPADVIKAIKDRKAKVEFVIDSTRSWIIDGAKITAASAADFSILPGNADKSALRGVTGADIKVNGTGVPTDLKLTLRREFAGQFANLYKLTNGKLVFQNCVKVDENGIAVVPGAYAKGEYVVMVCELSNTPGDMNNDGVLNALDASAILKSVIGAETGANPLMADFNGDGAVNALDASAILKWIIAA